MDTEKKDAAKVEAYEDVMDEFIQKQSAIHSRILGLSPEKIQIRFLRHLLVSDMWAELCRFFEDQNAIIHKFRIRIFCLRKCVKSY